MAEDINYALDDYEEDYIEVEDDVVQEDVQEEAVTQPVVPEQPAKVNIEGLGEFTVEEIKEFKQGYMRQSDYTRKTQELAKQRKELEQLEQAPIYGTPQAPNAQPAIYTDPVLDRVAKLEQEIANKELDSMLTNLKQTYPDFDEVEVLNTAYKMGVTDLEFVYKGLRKDKAEATTNNESALREKYRQEILQELKETRDSTSTIITGEGSSNVSVPQLSKQELMIAKNMGLTPEEYAKYK